MRKKNKKIIIKGIDLLIHSSGNKNRKGSVIKHRSLKDYTRKSKHKKIHNAEE